MHRLRAIVAREWGRGRGSVIDPSVFNAIALTMVFSPLIRYAVFTHKRSILTFIGELRQPYGASWRVEFTSCTDLYSPRNNGLFITAGAVPDEMPLDSGIKGALPGRIIEVTHLFSQNLGHYF